MTGLMRLNLAVLIVIAMTLCGCKAMDGLAAKLFMPKNPEDTRQEQETQRLEHTQQKIVEAQTPEQVQGLVDTHNKTSGGSHPSFWSSAVSALYTAEGRRIAGEVSAFLSLVGVMVWKTVSAKTGWRLVDNLLGTTKEILDRNPSNADQYLALLKSRQEQAGVRKTIRRRLKKIERKITVGIR